MAVCGVAYGQDAPAPASPSAPAADPAAEAKQQGDEALVSGRHAAALAAYKASYGLRPDAAVLYNIGRAHQALRDYPAALDALEGFERSAPPDVRARVPGLAVLLAEVRKHASMLAVSSDVPGATVRLDDRVLGTTPLPAPVRVNAGTATLVVEKEGFFPFQRAVTLTPGGVVAFDATLASKLTKAIVTVRSPSAGAKVAVDRKPEGTVPTELVVSPGSHDLELTLDGYRPLRTSIAVAAGERRALDLTLETESPITKKWWFWTGIGVLAVGATITVIALTTERSPSSGNVEPGRINAGLSF
jgi:hypothetical protein